MVAGVRVKEQGGGQNAEGYPILIPAPAAQNVLADVGWTTVNRTGRLGIRAASCKAYHQKGVARTE